MLGAQINVLLVVCHTRVLLGILLGGIANRLALVLRHSISIFFTLDGKSAPIWTNCVGLSSSWTTSNLPFGIGLKICFDLGIRTELIVLQDFVFPYVEIDHVECYIFLSLP